MDGAPEGASLDPVTGAFRWTPPGNASGSYAVTFTASDGHSSSSETVTIAVADANHAPLFVPAGLQLVREGTNLVFRVVANDPDADPLPLSVVSGLPGGATLVATGGEVQGNTDRDTAAAHVVRISMIDIQGGSQQKRS